MYSKKKGKSGSKKPLKPAKHVWLSYTPKEVEQLVIKQAKAGKTSSEIGIILRDAYGDPSVKEITKTKISKILKDNALAKDLPDDLASLIKRKNKLVKHVENNKHDEFGKRGLLLTESKIRRLVKYYKRSQKLPPDWVYEAQPRTTA